MFAWLICCAVIICGCASQQPTMVGLAVQFITFAHAVRWRCTWHTWRLAGLQALTAQVTFHVPIVHSPFHPGFPVSLFISSLCNLYTHL